MNRFHSRLGNVASHTYTIHLVERAANKPVAINLLPQSASLSDSTSVLAKHTNATTAKLQSHAFLSGQNHH